VKDNSPLIRYPRVPHIPNLMSNLYEYGCSRNKWLHSVQLLELAVTIFGLFLAHFEKCKESKNESGLYLMAFYNFFFVSLVSDSFLYYTSSTFSQQSITAIFVAFELFELAFPIGLFYIFWIYAAFMEKRGQCPNVI
jgi:membrane-associated HD superfamily phosphohydrolase